jgi:hypothetical protein
VSNTLPSTSIGSGAGIREILRRWVRRTEGSKGERDEDVRSVRELRSRSRMGNVEDES